MNEHPYLRAYMAGIALPTAFLLVALTVFCVARFVAQVPIPIERAIVFPMALIPNNAVHVPMVRIALLLPIGIAIYYLAWKYVVSFFNRLVEIEE
jgi:hypothetical protein